MKEIPPGATHIARELLASEALYFPGRDYPDREKWLAKRDTPKRIVSENMIYHTQGERKPLRLGLNAAKRAAKADKLDGGVLHQDIVRQRHAYYRRRAVQ